VGHDCEKGWVKIVGNDTTDLERAWVREKWDAVMRALAERRPQPRTNHFIDDRIDVVPSYLWTAGCAPTSATMVLGYWDWDSPIGRRLGYGRLSPFSFERRAIINYSDDEGVPYHFDANATDPIGCLGIPYSVYALARGMHTEATHGGTWIGSGAHNIQDGIINWTNNESGYGFSSSESFTTWDYNPLWNTIRAEINADRPCEWSRNGNWQGGPSGTHAVAVFGYSDGGDVYYRNTWDLGVHWDQYQGNGQSMADVTTAVPGGGSGDNDVDLIAPDGGEAWGAGSVHAITWHQWGGTIDRAVIEYSYSSGYMWDAVGTSASVPGGNQYWWTVPCSISDDVFVRISAYDGATLVAREGSSERWSIAWPTVPDVPILLSPGDGETCESTTGSLDWSDVGGATGYMVQLWTTCGTGTEYPTTGSNYSYSGLQPNTTYYWRVKTRTSCDVWGSYSACFTFTTAPTLPGIPAPVAPADGSTCQGTAGTVTWVGVPGAAGYAYRVGEYCGGGSETETSATSGLYSGLQPGVTYHWQVKAKNSCDQWGPYCECFSFATTPSPPSAPTLISPENGASDQPLSGELDWGDASGAEAYAYQLDMSCGQGSEQVVPSSQASYSGLLPGATYFWRVKARDACGQWGSYTACRWFTTVGGSGGAAACCAGGSCALLTETECGAAQGAWHPEWSSCEPNPCADTTLVAYWPYDEGNGDTSRDGSGKGHVMHAVNGAGFTSNGFLGSAASLEGGDERWETPDAADLRGMSRLTIDAWVYPLGVVENKNLGVVTHWPNGRDCYFLVLQPDGRPWAAIRGSSRVDLVANQVLPLSRWSRLTIVYDGATLDLFVDGRLDASTAAPVGALNNYADPLYVGRNNFDAQSPGTFVGYIDEVRIHRAAVYPSPGPAGACCVAGLCTLTTEEECFSIEGVWHSEWASCEPNPCQQTERACCYGDTCVVTTESACADLSGIWRPDRAACLPTPCSEGGGDLSGGVFIAHAPPEMQYSDVAPPDGWCQEYFSRNPLWRAEDQVNRIDSMIPSRIWYVLAAWEGGRRWCATEFGLGDYEPGEFTLLGYGPCYQSGAQGIETSSSGWPGPREGTALVLTAGEWSGNYSPVYWFALYAYYEEVIPLAPNPAHSGGPFGGFVSCEDPLTAYPAVCFGALGLYTDGVACYPGVLAERACCSDGQCMLLSQSECGSISGVWHSEWTSCEPNPCPQPERGACCLPDSSCVWSSEGHCAQLSGVWHRYRECESYQCTAPLPCHGEVDTLENADGEWGGYISSMLCHWIE